MASDAFCFEGIKKVKRSIIYSSSAGNSVRQAPSVRAAASHFVWRRSESRGLAAAEREMRLNLEFPILWESFVGVTRLFSVYLHYNRKVIRELANNETMELDSPIGNQIKVRFEKFY